MTFNYPREVATESLADHKTSIPVRVLEAGWHADVLWAVWLAVRETRRR